MWWGPGVNIVCFVVVLVAEDGFAGVCNDLTPLKYGLYMTPEFDFKTAVKCCEAYGMDLYDIRQSNERDIAIVNRFAELVNNEDIFWVAYNDLINEKRNEIPIGNSLSLLENVILSQGNLEEKDCMVMPNIRDVVMEWEDCNRKHRLICRDVKEYKKAPL